MTPKFRPIVAIQRGMISGTSKADLENSGYCVVEVDDMAHIKIVETVFLPDQAEIIWDAMMVGLGHSPAARERMGHALYAALQTATPQKRS